jgi:sarcosine oxidase subunit beta
VEHALHRVPPLARASVRRGWAGLYDTTPDSNPILGRVPGLEGFIMAAGFSGHGFMLSPAVGECLAELIITGGSKTVDLTSLSITRFLSGALRQEANVI